MTIKEAQELVSVWNEKNSPDSEFITDIAYLNEKVGELTRTAALSLNVSGKSATDIYEDQLADIFWSLLTLASKTGSDLTDGLIDTLDKKNESK